MSTAMAHLNPVRHHLNLTVRGGVFARKILIEDGKAVGVEAESGGQVFQIAANRVVLSAGAIRSPHPSPTLRGFSVRDGDRLAFSRLSQHADSEIHRTS